MTRPVVAALQRAESVVVISEHAQSLGYDAVVGIQGQTGSSSGIRAA